MSDRQETTDDIIREMRDLGALDTQCNDMIPRSLQALGLRTYAGRLQAATKREKVEAVTIAASKAVNLTNEKCRRDAGNAVALREALDGVLSALADVGFHPYVYGDQLAVAVIKARAALAAPPRNCDRFTDEDDAFAAWHDSLKDGDIVSVRNAFAWLFAPAEGDAE